MDAKKVKEYVLDNRLDEKQLQEVVTNSETILIRTKFRLKNGKNPTNNEAKDNA